MAFSIPQTWTAIVVSVADMNREIRDNMLALLNGSDPGCQARLTLTTGVPVPSTDVTAATNVYLTPYGGGRVWLYDGSAYWIPYSFSQITISLAAFAANTNFDVFAYLSGGNVVTETVAWTNATTRATGLVLQNGIYVKSGTTTKRYIGTFRTTGTIGQCEDSLTKRFCWNYHNRRWRPWQRMESTSTWTYSTGAYRQANGSASNQVEAVVGVSEDPIDLTVVGHAENSAGAVNLLTAIGEDSTTAALANSIVGYHSPADTSQPRDIVPMMAKATKVILGYHYYAWLELGGASGTTTWQGTSGGGQSGMLGGVWG